MSVRPLEDRILIKPLDPETKTVVVHTAVHASPRDLAARAEQFSFFYGVLNSLKPPS